MTKALGVRSVICALTAGGLLLGAPAIASAAPGSSAQVLCGGDKKDTKKKDDKKTPDQPSFR